MKTVLSIVATVVLVVAGVFFVVPKSNVQLGSVGGLQATVATSSFRSVTTATVNLLFSTSTSCTSRVIGNQAGELLLTFNDRIGERPTGVRGVVQAASTTVVYDAEQYGCGAVYVYPYGTKTLTLIETL